MKRVDFSVGAAIELPAVESGAAIAFVDLEELNEALALFYVGELNRVNPIHVCNELTDLIPGKPLISQLEHSDILAAMEGVDGIDRRALRNFYTHSPPVEGSIYAAIDEYPAEFIGALIRLGKRVAKQL